MARAEVLFFLLLSLSLVSVLISGFSIHYAYDEEKNHAAVIRPAGRPIHFTESPSPEQVRVFIFLLVLIC